MITTKDQVNALVMASAKMKTLPILRNIRATAGTLEATDLSVAVRITDASITADGFIDAATLKRGGLGVTLSNWDVLQDRESTAEDWPELPTANDTPTELNMATISAMVESLSAVSTDDTRPVLTGIHLSNGAVTATDGYRLFSKGGGHSIEALIPAKVAKIIKATKLIDNNWRYGESENQATFTNGSITIIAQKIEGNYPEWQGLLPKSSEYHMKIEAKALADAVKLLKGGDPLSLHITTEGAATVQAGDRKLELQTTIETGVRPTNPNNVHIVMPLKTTGVDEIALNPRYITDAIGKNKHILIDFNENKFGPVDVHGVVR